MQIFINLHEMRTIKKELIGQSQEAYSFMVKAEKILGDQIMKIFRIKRDKENYRTDNSFRYDE